MNSAIEIINREARSVLFLVIEVLYVISDAAREFFLNILISVVRVSR